MNPSEILQQSRNLDSAEDRQLLWYLHSRFIEDGDFEKLTAELMAFRPEGYSKIVRKPRNDHRTIDSGYIFKLLSDFCSGYDYPSGGLMTTLQEFKSSRSAEIKRGFHLTNIGKNVWETLDWCLEERRPCFIEGREGRGKSASALAWAQSHRDTARYVSLPGLGIQRDFFTALAVAYGVNFSSAKAPNQIRWRVRDMIVRSGLVLVIDEAHHVLPERHRAGRPALIDWIDCDLCNSGVPVVLISTPQFGPRLAEFEDRTQWNAGQFRRRFSGRWSCLPDKTTDDDLAALAQKFLPQVGSKGVKLAVGYAGTFGRDVSGLFDLVRDAERRARQAGRSAVTYPDLLEAYKLDRVPSENAMAQAFKRKATFDPQSEGSDESNEQILPAVEALQRGSRPAAATDFPTRLNRKTEPELVSQ